MTTKQNTLIRLLLVLVAVVVISMPDAALTRKVDTDQCSWNPTTPNLENARINFTAGRYACSRLELDYLLAIDTLKGKARADAHGLMAAVEYATHHDPRERRQKTRLQFVAAFRAHRFWRGDLEIPEYEFRQIMKDARELVEWIHANTPEPEPVVVDTVEVVTLEPSLPDTAQAVVKKPWYRKWWAVGSGVGLFAMAVAVLGSSGDSQVDVEQPPTPVDTLPGFPPPP
jgi:hypothetical protein